MAKIKAALSGGRVSSNSKSAFELFASQRFGERSGEKIYYSLSESLFLINSKKMDLYQKDKKLTEKQIMNRFEKLDKNFKTKYAVFKDLRKRGYIVKTALKFGAEFRVYEKGSSIGENHAKWIVHTAPETAELTWHEFTSKARVAHSTRKNLLIALVDEEQDVSYYEVGWIKP